MKNTKIRIVEILSQGAYGGIERSVQWFAQEADRSKFDYYFLFLYKGGPIRDLISSMGFPTQVLGWKNGYSLKGRLELMKIIADIKPDLIHDHCITPLSRVFMKMSARTPIISTNHTLGGIENKWIAPFLLIDDRITSQVIANSKFTAQKHSLLFKRSLSKIKVIYLGINPDNYRNSIDISVSPLGKMKKLNIAFIGRLVENKGVMHIPLLARSLKNHGENFVINVAGDGPMMEECKKLTCELGVSDNIRFLGWKSDVAEVLHDADLFIFLSLWEEPFGIVLIEAMAAGVPVFAYSGGGIFESIGNAPAPFGWIIPKGDYEQMADSIINNKEQCLNCDKLVGYNYVKEKFNITRVVDETQRVYLEYTSS